MVGKGPLRVFLVLGSLFVELVEWMLIDLPIDIYMYEGGLVWKIH